MPPTPMSVAAPAAVSETAAPAITTASRAWACMSNVTVCGPAAPGPAAPTTRLAPLRPDEDRRPAAQGVLACVVPGIALARGGCRSGRASGPPPPEPAPPARRPAVGWLRSVGSRPAAGRAGGRRDGAADAGGPVDGSRRPATASDNCQQSAMPPFFPRFSCLGGTTREASAWDPNSAALSHSATDSPPRAEAGRAPEPADTMSGRRTVPCRCAIIFTRHSARRGRGRSFTASGQP